MEIILPSETWRGNIFPPNGAIHTVGPSVCVSQTGRRVRFSGSRCVEQSQHSRTLNRLFSFPVSGRSTAVAPGPQGYSHAWSRV
jgi:hypothetical protein